MASVSVVHWTDTPPSRSSAWSLSIPGNRTSSLWRSSFSTKTFFLNRKFDFCFSLLLLIFFSVSRRHRSESERSEELQDSGKGRLPSKFRDVETRRMFLFGQEVEPSGFAQVDVECSSLPWRPHHWQKAVCGSLASSKRLIKYSRHEFRHYS